MLHALQYRRLSTTPRYNTFHAHRLLCLSQWDLAVAIEYGTLTDNSVGWWCRIAWSQKLVLSSHLPVLQ